MTKLVKDIAAFCFRMPKKLGKFDLLKTTTTLQSDIGVPRVVCRRTRKVLWPSLEASLITCLMNRSTTIETNNTRVDDDSNARALYMSENKNIFYLPVDLYKVFPFLLVINAMSCSVKTLGPENLRNLKFLEMIWMGGNQLEIIPKGTFKGLTSLTTIYLSKLFLLEIVIPIFIAFTSRLQQDQIDPFRRLQWTRESG